MMMTRLQSFATRFRKDEDGNSTVEFAVYFTAIFLLLAASVEIAYINLRHAMLERGVDLATRDIRLSTGDIPTYETTRAMICSKAAILDDCEANLRLEMVQVSPRDLSGAPTDADCQNGEDDPRPVRNYTPGQDNDLMLMRACLMYKPMLPTTSLGKQLNKDEHGYAQLIVTAAFVQEPR